MNLETTTNRRGEDAMHSNGMRPHRVTRGIRACLSMPSRHLDEAGQCWNSEPADSF